MIYKNLIRPVLFSVNPEKIHTLTLNSINNVIAKSVLSALCKRGDKNLKRTVFGIDFPNPVGLAAGFDKNARFIESFDALGFGFIEIGTVTPKAQPGNPKPRLFRLKKDNAIINRMGFNNHGVEKAVENIKAQSGKIIIGGNIGKNKITPNAQATEDYLLSFEALFPYVDYFVVNVSSPNTPGLRELQEKEPLTKLLNALQEKNEKGAKRKPILLKIAPDVTHSQLDDIIEIVETTHLDGLVATNTTIERSGLSTSQAIVEQIGAGGLSGKPVFERSTEVLRYIKKHSDKPVIGVGGISSVEQAIEKLNAGADLIQIYSGLLYEGPLFIKRINKAIGKAF